MIKLSPEEKFNLTINEASAYFNIGRDKLYELAKEEGNIYTLHNGKTAYSAKTEHSLRMSGALFR